MHISKILVTYSLKVIQAIFLILLCLKQTYMGRVFYCSMFVLKKFWISEYFRFLIFGLEMLNL